MNPVLTIEVAHLAHEERLREAVAWRGAGRAVPGPVRTTLGHALEAAGRALQRAGHALAGRAVVVRPASRVV